mgnify:FL=1
MDNREPITIVLIEDSDLDADLTIRALHQHNFGNQIVRLSDGLEAMEYFFPDRKKQTGMEVDKPKLILLDIKLPGINGLEVLKALKNDHTTRKYPVVILTSSTEDRDIKTCYELGVNSFISKPVEYDSFVETVHTLGMYWLLMNKAP